LQTGPVFCHGLGQLKQPPQTPAELPDPNEACY
jgi:hypothetical protein